MHDMMIGFDINLLKSRRYITMDTIRKLRESEDKMFEKALNILSNYPITKLFLSAFITLLLSNLAFTNGEYIGKFIYSILH